MLTDIFSAFDPGTRSIFIALPSPFFWLINLLLLSIVFSSFWVQPSHIFFLLSYPKEIINSQVRRTHGTHLKGFRTIITALFITIIIINLAGLLPYVFRTSRHLYFTLALGLPLWIALIISSFSNSPSQFTAGLLPGGAPDWLNPFLVLIETTSIIIRPITLSFRLVANIRAGHILLGLIGIYASAAIFSSIKAFSFLIALQTFYTLFEMAICLIQAYIFCLLLSLYADDHTRN